MNHFMAHFEPTNQIISKIARSLVTLSLCTQEVVCNKFNRIPHVDITSITVFSVVLLRAKQYLKHP